MPMATASCAVTAAARVVESHYVGHEATRENRSGSENRCVNQTTDDVLSAAIVRSTMIYVLMTAVLW